MAGSAAMKDLLFHSGNLEDGGNLSGVGLWGEMYVLFEVWEEGEDGGEGVLDCLGGWVGGLG